MRVSEKRRQAIYDAIRDAVTDARLAVIRTQGGVEKTDNRIDGAVAQVTDRAFAAVMRALGQ